jgi:uncharacterized protein YciI
MPRTAKILILSLLVALNSLASMAAAEEVGGFEMTTYYVGFLYRGAKWTPEVTPESERLQEAHMANIRRMGAEGKLLVAGPFADDGTLRGMYVFKVGTKEEAEALVKSDPAVQAGRLRFELHPWFAAKNIVVTPHATSPAAGR